MKKHVAAFFAGVGTAVLVGVGASAYRHRGQIAQKGRDFAERGRTRGRQIAHHGRRIAQEGQRFVQQFRPRPDIDLNGCPIENLVAAGLDRETADRVVENRPYRSKLELIQRVMLPNDLYARIKNRVWISGADEPVKVAS